MDARRWFHVFVGAVFLPVLSLPVAWGAAVFCWWRRGNSGDRTWARRLLGLAAADTLVAVAIVAAVVTDRPLDPEPARPARRVVIGVTPDPSFQGPGLRLRVVTQGGPAAIAGVRVGDVLLTANGVPVESPESLRTLVAEKGPGADIELGLLRDGAATTIRLQSVWSNEIRPPRQRLFQAEKTGRACVDWSDFRWPWPETLEVLALVALAVVATRHGSGAGVWFTALAIVGAAVGTAVVWQGACLLLGGPSLGGVELGLLGTTAGLGGVALLGRAAVRPPQGQRTRDVGSTVLLGFWYALPGALRLVIVLATLRAFLPWNSHAGGSPIVGVAQAVSATEGPGFLLLALFAVVIAPVAEELTFRGLLLPSLTGWLGTTGAIWISATIFGGLHWYYGIMIPVTIFQGLVLGWARVVSGGLRAPILLHAGFNLVPIAVLGLKAIHAG